MRLLPLIGSPMDGEALNACRALVKTLAAVGLDLHDMAASIPTAADVARCPSNSLHCEAPDTV